MAGAGTGISPCAVCTWPEPSTGGVDDTDEGCSQAMAAALCAVAGSMIGAVILFEAARKGGERYLEHKLHTGRGKRLRDAFPASAWSVSKSANIFRVTALIRKATCARFITTSAL